MRYLRNIRFFYVYGEIIILQLIHKFHSNVDSYKEEFECLFQICKCRSRVT